MIKKYVKSIGKILGERIIITCKQGPLKGFRLLGVVPIRFLKGTYEKELTNAFTNVAKDGYIIYDIGAHMGWYTLIASRLVGPSGKVFAFEPHPYNLRILNKHLEINNISNCIVIPAAVSDRSGKARFKLGTGTGTGHLSDFGEIEVETVCIDDLVSQGVLLPPNIIKIDVEGSEIKVLNGALYTLQLYHPIIFLSIHDLSELDIINKLLLPIEYKYSILRHSTREAEIIYQF